MVSPSCHVDLCRLTEEHIQAHSNILLTGPKQHFISQKDATVPKHTSYKPKKTQLYLGGRSLCDRLHSPQHAESQLQVARAENSSQVGGQVRYMVACDATDGAEVGGHLLHHVTVAQASYLSHQIKSMAMKTTSSQLQ